MTLIHKKMTIEEIVEQYPQTIGQLSEMGVKCFVCGEPSWGTLEENVNNKGLTNLDEIVESLNRIILNDNSMKERV